MTDIEYLRTIAQNKNLPQLMRDQLSSAAAEIERARCVPARQGDSLGSGHRLEPEVLAYATHHDEPMLFPSSKEAAAYCDDGEQPIALISLADYQALQAACAQQRGEPIGWRWHVKLGGETVDQGCVWQTEKPDLTAALHHVEGATIEYMPVY